MFHRYLGISKEDFLKNNVVPANDNDAFNDNKCTFCWDMYHEEHPAVRVLPCNHVFGRQCLHTMVAAPRGDLCPICGASLFRPALGVAIEAWIMSGLLALFQMINFLVHRTKAVIRALRTYLATLPFGIGHIIVHAWFFYLDSRNPFYYSYHLVRNFTRLPGRNPSLDLRHNISDYVVWMACTRLASYVISGYVTIPELWRLVVGVLIISYINWSHMTNYKDRVIFGFIMVASLVIGYLVAVVSPFESFGIQSLKQFN